MITSPFAIKGAFSGKGESVTDIFCPLIKTLLTSTTIEHFLPFLILSLLSL